MATINDGLSTYHLSTGTHRAYQPAKGNFFEFIVEDLGSLLKPGVEEALAEDSDYIDNGQEVIRLTVNKFSVPRFELEDISSAKEIPSCITRELRHSTMAHSNSTT